MRHCINVNNESFKALAIESGLHPAVLSSKIGVWQDTNNTEEFPTLQQLDLNNNNENGVLLQQSNIKFLNVSENKELYKSANLLAEDGNSKFFSTKNIEKAKIFAAERNIDKDFIGKYRFHVRPALSATKDGVRIFIEKIQPKDGQLSIFDQKSLSPKYVSSILSDPLSKSSILSFSAELKYLFDRMLGKANKMPLRASKHALRTLYELASSLSKMTNTKFEIISEEKAIKLLGSTFEIGSHGAYDPNTNTAYIIEGNFDQTTLVHEIFTHPFLIY